MRCAVGPPLDPRCICDLVLYQCVACVTDTSALLYLSSDFGWCLFYSLCFFIWIHPWRWVCMIFQPWEFRAMFLRGFGGLGSASLFGSLNAAWTIFDNSLIALIWESPNWKGDHGRGVCKEFSRYAAAWTDMSLELMFGIFINAGKKAIVSGVLYPSGNWRTIHGIRSAFWCSEDKDGFLERGARLFYA